MDYNQINVIDKSTYLEFRKVWKEEYLKNINDIRQKKLDIKEAQRNGNYGKIYKIKSEYQQIISKINDMIVYKKTEAEKAQARYLLERTVNHAHG